MNIIENKAWSQEENTIINIIIKEWNLSIENYQTLRRQAQRFKKSSELISLLMDSNKNWERLQQLISQKISVTSTIVNHSGAPKGQQPINFTSNNSQIITKNLQKLEIKQNNPPLQDSFPTVFKQENFSQDTNNSNQYVIAQNQRIQQQTQKTGIKSILSCQQKTNDKRVYDERESNQTQYIGQFSKEKHNFSNINNSLYNNQQNGINYIDQTNTDAQEQFQIDEQIGKKSEIILEQKVQNKSFTNNFTGGKQIVEPQSSMLNQQNIQRNQFESGNLRSDKSYIPIQQRSQQQTTLNQQTNFKQQIATNPVDQQQNNQYQFDNQLKLEFQTLNKKDFTKIFNLVDNLYQILSSNKNENSLGVFSNSSDLTVEDLTTLCVGVKQIFTYYPRSVQLVSVILLFNHESQNGRLAQIYTGEGKTLIVAMLAVLLSKKKNSNVDIITSSAVLAKRDSEEYSKFYEYFKLTVSHNIHKNEEIQDGVLSCYNCQIIYGDASSFQADILRHEYSEQGSMGNRKQQYAIIDEVDSMLIDGHKNKTLLSSPIPGMLDLSKVLTLIWDEICKVQPFLSTDCKVMITDKDEYYSVDLEEYIEQTLDKQLMKAVIQFISII